MLTADRTEAVAAPRPVTSPQAPSNNPAQSADIHVAVLTAGRDRPYALGVASMLVEQGIKSDFIGGDSVDSPELHQTSLINFLNLRDQAANAGAARKALRVLEYYVRLLGYAVTARPKIFHILWQNKFDFIDRTLVMGFYKLLGKRLVFTAHNVNAGKRDGNDTIWNRISLKSQYRLADHIFVHTNKMRDELLTEFNVPAAKVSVIPFGINNTLPHSSMSKDEARQRLGVGAKDKTVLFFGNIARYKGVEYLVEAFSKLLKEDPTYRLIVAGRPKGEEEYCANLRSQIDRIGCGNRIIQKFAFIPDEDVEIYCKAADVLVLPYRHIFQSGVLFVGYSFGLPVLASDVGSLKEEIVEGKTGFVFKPDDSADLAEFLRKYFASDLYRNLDHHRESIRKFANERYSWTKVGDITKSVYSALLKH